MKYEVFVARVAVAGHSIVSITVYQEGHLRFHSSCRWHWHRSFRCNVWSVPAACAACIPVVLRPAAGCLCGGRGVIRVIAAAAPVPCVRPPVGTKTASAAYARSHIQAGTETLISFCEASACTVTPDGCAILPGTGSGSNVWHGSYLRSRKDLLRCAKRPTVTSSSV